MTSAVDHLFTLAELWPHIEASGRQYGYDGRLIAGVMLQESGFRNWRVHADGTGHGLFGLDDNGLLPDFENWTGQRFGRGRTAQMIPPALQIAYAAMALARYSAKFGDPWAATRAWHRGERLMNDAAGLNYERLIRTHVSRLFG